MDSSDSPPAGTAREIEAFEALLRRYGRRIYQLAYRMAGNEADASDLTQEAFIRVWRAFRRIDPEANLESWLYRIVTNLYIDLLRRRPRVRLESLDVPVRTPKGDEVRREIPDERSDPAEAVLGRRLDVEIQRALVALGPELRMVVVLSDIEGQSYEEISATLRIPIGTVKSRLHRARRILQGRLAHLMLKAGPGGEQR
ncbi:MAG: sigma-70 family RNA polymerase sigma factor [Armatimonadota bacterium]|nr:sigma-70 family RNA polymerase sigma factor [Armatimonadota bacterium]MDR7450466.1 sigma-70 family RNA polymerase sigma factor [Armatimonadota bacterium]MDR7466951.1 sigma-70 family RNA polymerase sigma factor [Armatimonadota bacterium]MDR7493507.1 sigma-70 family RNA polymerase sigma factor [Armatimonadota bacterium]MDR7498772.1 sigma-70 family RNA polymerase sigma factor [Armatimonadota bacterium]